MTRTIHGMVYNAMKLFMEINPQLFDDCSHEYTEQQNNAAAREALRQRKWAAIQEQADRRKAAMAAAKANSGNPANSANGSSEKSGPPPRQKVVPTLPRVDEVDTADDNQKRLNSLKLQDGGDRRDRRPEMHDRQNSIGSSRSQR